MIQYKGNYSKKTFDSLKKYVFSSYPSQPKTMSIVSMYVFALSLDGKNTTTEYHVLEITKSNEIKLRLLENERSIGNWETITSMALQGFDYDTLIFGTKKGNIILHRYDQMPPDTQTIRLFGFPNLDNLPP